MFPIRSTGSHYRGLPWTASLKPSRLIRRVSTVFAPILVSASLAGCGGSRASSPTSSRELPEPPGKTVFYKGPAPNWETRHVIVVSSRNFGSVLADGKHHVLYAFSPDAPGAACSDSCNVTWPPFQLTHGKVLDTATALEVPLVSVVPDPEGGRMVKYANWLLHNYIGDRSPESTAGQGLDSFGGHWYLISSSGRLVERGPTRTSHRG
jgi:predicted lipoprotein with Yx(FWY)xxD motif